jgi:MYXO-CTERM domain-containing protein
LSPSATSTSKPSSSNRTVKIVLPIVCVFAVALLGALAFFLLRRRRQQRSVQATVRHTPGRQRGYHYVPTSQIEGARGRRVSIASMVSRDYQTDSAPQSPPTPHRDPPGGRAGYIDPYPFNIVPRTYPGTQRAGENFPRTGSVLSDPTPQDIASPAQTNWSSFYTSVRGHGEAYQQPRSGIGEPSGGTSSLIWSGTGATYAGSSEGGRTPEENRMCI